MIRALRRASLEPAALAGMIVYLAGCLLLAPSFPFGRVDMFADVGPRYEGASPRLLADGRDVEPAELVDFRGLGPEDVVAGRMPCSQGYRIDEIRNHVASHQAREGAPPGDVEVSFAWRRYHVDPEGRLVRDADVIAATGTARRAP